MRTRWKFWYNRHEASFGVTFDGTAFKGRSEYGVSFMIRIWEDILQIETEVSRTGYLLTDGFSSVIKGILGDSESGSNISDGRTSRFSPGSELVTLWKMPKDKRQETLRTIENFLKEAPP
jgi:hypothetical protein